MNYRREIDGLRAVAVLAVILYHARIPGFTGGFIGVNVFFVISGFLITGLISREMEQQTFSIVRFYERRARRILPALFLVMAAALPLSWWLLTPSELVSFGNSVRAVGLFLSNWLFWQDSDYFSPAADFKPLLHTWSLSLEEQFYIVFPLFLLLVRRLSRRWVIAIMVVGALSSLVLAEVFVRERPVVVFYLPPTRIWELMAGAILAVLVRDRPLYRRFHPDFAGVAAAVGLLAIVAAALLYDTHTPFPGLSAVIPVAGTWLVLAFAHPHTRVGRLLAQPVLVHLGLISYSLYLWHHPVFVFGRLAFDFTLDTQTTLALLGLTLVLAEMSWRYVERPFRHVGVISRRGVFVFSVLATAAFVSLGQLGLARAGWPERLDKSQTRKAEWLRYSVTGLYRSRLCFLDPDQKFVDLAPECAQGGVALWGDSHAASLYSGLAAAMPTAQFTASACPPALGYRARSRPECPGFNAGVLDTLVRQGPRQVIMLANWGAYLHDDAFAEALVETLRQMKSAGLEPVILGSLPQWQPSLPRMWMKATKDVRDLPAATLPELMRVDARMRILADDAGVRFVDVLDRQCRDGKCRAIVPTATGDLAPMAWDYGHLTREGAAAMVESLRRKLPDPAR